MFERVVLKDIRTTGPAEKLSRLWRFINFQLRIWPQCLKLLVKESCNPGCGRIVISDYFRHRAACYRCADGFCVDQFHFESRFQC